MQTLRNRTFLPLKFYFDKKVRKLNFIFFELTQKCNLSCVHCGSDCNKDNNSADLPADVILKTLIDVKKKFDSHKITIVLSGGEPTIYPGVWDLGKKIIDLEFPWGMVTNGLSWDEKTIKKAKESRMHSATVSIDGLEENHNWFRGNPKSFRKAKNALKMILETPEIYKKDVVTVVNRRNLNELDDIYEMLKKMGLKRWRLTGVDPIGRAKDNPDLFLKPDEYVKFMEKIKELRNRREIDLMYACNGYMGPFYENDIRSRPFFCMAGINVAGVMVDGSILACPNIDRKLSQGNIYNDSLVDVWENKFKPFIDRSWKKTDICSDCSEWKMCEGGPMHLWNYEEKTLSLCHYKDLILNGEKK